MKLSKGKVLPIIMSALSEDIGSGDITTDAVIEKDYIVSAEIVALEECVAAGIDIVRWVFNALDESIIFKPLYKDGDSVKKGKKVISLRGSLKKILAGERVALNFLGRLSGVATLTKRFVQKAKNPKVKIYDTRKSIPGLMLLDKYAITIGGGYNHRKGLWDGILIKDNHLISVKCKVKSVKLNAIEDAVSACKLSGYRDVEIEVNDLDEFKKALSAGADIIMLDNMKAEDVRKAVRLRDKKYERVLLESSGGVNLENVSKFAKTGVDRISVGSLTHSVPSIDFSLEIRCNTT